MIAWKNVFKKYICSKWNTKSFLVHAKTSVIKVLLNWFFKQSEIVSNITASTKNIYKIIAYTYGPYMQSHIWEGDLSMFFKSYYITLMKIIKIKYKNKFTFQYSENTVYSVFTIFVIYNILTLIKRTRIFNQMKNIS